MNEAGDAPWIAAAGGTTDVEEADAGSRQDIAGKPGLSAAERTGKHAEEATTRTAAARCLGNRFGEVLAELAQSGAELS